VHVYLQVPGTTPSGGSSTPAVLPIPPDDLRRHSARVLEPTRAEALPDDPPLGPTVYRHHVLLIPTAVASNPGVIASINAALNPAGLLVVPAILSAASVGRLILRAASRGALPTVIDAWRALQILRAAARAGQLPADLVAQISLEHLLLGVPVDPDNGAWHGSPVGGGVASSYGPPDLAFRRPIELLLAPPARRPDLRRRPVIAILDSGIGPNPWLGIPASGPLPAGSRVRVDGGLQQLVRLLGQQEKAVSPNSRVLLDEWDQPASSQPLIGELDSHSGHGTFAAGIVAQIAPDADTLIVRVMHSDGILYEADVLCVLDRLIDQITAAQQAGAAAAIVDILCLPFGFFAESPRAATPLLDRLRRLLRLGVLVVAAAGNEATSERFYPAAGSIELPLDPSPPALPLLAVGALNPNGSIALYSNEAAWVTCWASGSVIASTYPVAQGSRNAGNGLERTGAPRPLDRRQALDDDDFSTGFAVWSGTSFATPVAAAAIATALLGLVEQPSLDLLQPAQMTSRALAAMANVRANSS